MIKDLNRLRFYFHFPCLAVQVSVKTVFNAIRKNLEISERGGVEQIRISVLSDAEWKYQVPLKCSINKK